MPSWTCTLIQKTLLAYSVSPRKMHVSLVLSVFPKPLGKAKADKKGWAQRNAVGALCKSLLFYFIATFGFVPFQRRLVKEITACIRSRLLILCSNRPNFKNGLPNRRLTTEILLKIHSLVFAFISLKQSGFWLKIHLASPPFLIYMIILEKFLQ